MKTAALVLLLFTPLFAYNQSYKEITDSLVSYNLRLTSDCDTSLLTLNKIETYPLNYEYLESNNYCYPISPPSNSITFAFSFYCSNTTTAIINAGYSVLSCGSIDFTSVILYNNTTCEFVGEGFYFYLEEGNTYTWTITAISEGPFCQGFSTICPYWLESIPLLVNLLIFKGEVHNKYINLEWSTASESNSHYFIIQKSDGFSDFKDYLKLTASGNSSITKTYKIVDNNPYEGNNYYKLIEVDYNGIRNEYSTINVYNPYTINYEIYDQLGRITDLNTKGFKIIRYENGTIKCRYIINN